MNPKTLTQLGLTEGEAKVYLALSELGSSTVGPIVKKSHVAYSNIYDILNRLTKKGIISYIIKNKTKHFQAASPTNLNTYLEKKEQELQKQKQTLREIIPSLEKLQEIKPSQEAEIFIGKKGLKTAYEKLTKNLNKKDEALFFYIYKKEFAEESDLFYNSLSEIGKKMQSKGICNEDYKNSWFSKKAKYLDMKFTNIPIPGNIDIIKDKVLMTSWHNTIFSVLIHSKPLADDLRIYFNQIWKTIK